MNKQTEISVPLLDLKAQYQQLKDEIKPVIDEVCASQHFILGPYVKQLETAVAEYCQCKVGIGVSSGTDALLVALMGLDVGQGDEVITTPYTFFATAGVVARVGARPLFCDIDPVTYNLSPEAVKNTIDAKCQVRDGKLYNRQTGGEVKVLMPVHLYGQTADMDPLMAIAKEYGLKVVEDAAQAIGSEYKDNRRAGSMGDIGCFSFFPSKNLGAFGDGGMCTTTDPELGEKLKILRVHGSKPKYYHALIGGNFRLDELQAAVLMIKLKYLDSWTRGRQENAAYYDELFSNTGISGVSTPVAVEGYRHIYNQYVIRTKDRDKLRQYLTDAKIGSEVYYPVPLHVQDCFKYLGYKADDCPQSMKAAEQTLALPIYPELSKQQQEYVVDKIAEFYK